eukprot:TRINITY_DN20719_c0_g1_i1.p1 TRINITY_DN20719_c0_g1~~TRINITY_DN20719_c0_g1_i1.p1  ORF type:complete len:778 (+),score=286.45 TRINITY_DN20719_c0_g1_i1:311-2335(+)
MMNMMPGVHPKPAGVKPDGPPQAGVPYGAPPPKRASHALPIVAPAGDPRGPNGKGATFEQMIAIQKEVMVNAQDYLMRNRTLMIFLDEFMMHWRPGKVNAITASKTRHSERDNTMRKVKGILNKLTPEKADKLKSQMIDVLGYAMSKTDEKERTDLLKDIVGLVYEEAVAVQDFTTVYADLCMDLSRHNVRTLNVSTGQEPFRKALITTCQHEYTVAIKKQEEEQGDEKEKAKVRRRALNNIHFVGELYKRQLLTEKIIHSVLKSLLIDEKVVLDDERLEKVVKLLETVGRSLEKDSKEPKVEEMERYFQKLEEVRIEKGSARLGFLIQDLLDLRQSGWEHKGRSGKASGPQTLQSISRQIMMEEMSRGAWQTPGLPGKVELRLPDVVSGFSTDPADENISKQLTRCDGEELTRLICEVLREALTGGAQKHASVIMRTLSRFISILGSAHLPVAVMLTRAVDPLMDQPADATCWPHFEAFLTGIIRQRLLESEVGSVIFGKCILGHDTPAATSVMSILIRANLPLRASTWIGLKAVKDGSDKAAAVKQASQDAARFSDNDTSAKLMSSLLDSNQTFDNQLAALKEETDVGQVVSALLASEWVRHSDAPEQLSSWISSKPKSETESLSAVLTPLGKDKVAVHMEVFHSNAATFVPERQAALKDFLHASTAFAHGL